MFGRNKSNQYQPEGLAPAEQVRRTQAARQQARMARNQRGFERWLQRWLFPEIDDCIMGAAKMKYRDSKQNFAYGLVSIRVDPRNNAVTVWSRRKFIPPAVESRYRALHFHVSTQTISEVPKYDYQGNKLDGRKPIEGPLAHLTTITW